MRNGHGKEVASVRVMIKKYVKLLPEDEFSSDLLIKRYTEQMNIKHRSSKWIRLHITNTELWLNGSYWWPDSILNGLCLNELCSLVTFYSTPNLLAMGLTSRLNVNNKEYVLLYTKSGTERDSLVKTLTTLCSDRCHTPEQKSSINPLVPVLKTTEFPMTNELKNPLNSDMFDHFNHDKRENTALKCYETKFDTNLSEKSPSSSCEQIEYLPETNNVSWIQEIIKPQRLKRFLSPFYERPEPGFNSKDLIYIFYHPKYGNVISNDGPTYLYCANYPNH